MGYRGLCACLLIASLHAFPLAQTSLAAENYGPHNLEVGDDLFGITLNVEGVECSGIKYLDPNRYEIRGDTGSAGEIKVYGKLRIGCSGPYVNQFSAGLIADSYDHTKTYAMNEIVFWDWEDTLDSRNSGDIRKEVPFSVAIPVPQYEPGKATVVDFTLHLSCKSFDHRWGDEIEPLESYYSMSLFGTAYLPKTELPKNPPPLLKITGGKPEEPLKITFELTDGATGKPLPEAFIRIALPIRGSVQLGYSDESESRQPLASLFDNLPGTEPRYLNNIGPQAKFWSLGGYFRCLDGTRCTNSSAVAPVSQFSEEYFYTPDDPALPIEVQTNQEGKAVLQFYLDLEALGPRVPRRSQPLEVPVIAEYAYWDENTGEQLLVRTTEVFKLKYLGIITGITCVEPQEFEENGTPLEYSNTEFPLANYWTMDLPKPEHRDEGTPLPFEKVYGADRVVFTPYIVALSEDNRQEIQRQALPAQTLRTGTLFSYGDEIRIDARGLIRTYKNQYGVEWLGKPGWIWVKVHWFDGTNAKVGVNGKFYNYGLDDRYYMTFGNTPEKTGWVPPKKAWINWTKRKVCEEVISNFHPVLGAVNTMSDVTNYLQWVGEVNPVFVRLQSEVFVSAQDDGTMLITVREGQPAVYTTETPDGMQAGAGSTLVVDASGAVSMRASTPEEIERADELLSDIRELDLSSIEPIEIEYDPQSAGSTAAEPEAPAVQPPPVDQPEEVPATAPPPTPATPEPEPESTINWVEQYVGHYPLDSPSASWKMADKCPSSAMSLSCKLNYTKPGMVLDTVGLNNAAPGNWALSVQADGRLCFQVFDTDGSTGTWYRFTTPEALSAGRDYWVLIDFSDGEVAMLVTDDITDEDTAAGGSLPAGLANAPVYAGDFPGDDWWGEGYNIHPAMTGQLDVYYFGPRITVSSPETYAGSYVIRY